MENPDHLMLQRSRWFAEDGQGMSNEVDDGVVVVGLFLPEMAA